jgi:hypothetical protein
MKIKNECDTSTVETQTQLYQCADQQYQPTNK